jgi:hypothetical protein
MAELMAREQDAQSPALDPSRGDLDGVAQGVVDLEGLAVEVEDPQGHLLLDGERIGPEEAGRPGRARKRKMYV